MRSHTLKSLLIGAADHVTILCHCSFAWSLLHFRYCASDRGQCDRPFTLAVSRLFHWSLIGICVWKTHPLSFLLSGSLNLPKPIFLFLFITAFSGCSSYLRVLLVSCGRLSLIPIVPIWKLKGKFLLLPMGLGQWTVDHSGVWTLPSLWYGESQLWAVCTRSNSSCINLRLFHSCRVRPLSCIIWAWPTERLLGQREKIYFKLSSHMQRFWHLTMITIWPSLQEKQCICFCIGFLKHLEPCFFCDQQMAVSTALKALAFWDLVEITCVQTVRGDHDLLSVVESVSGSGLDRYQDS